MPRGYDFDLELSFWEEGGVRYCLGTSGSLILVCPTCGEEHFRSDISIIENCFQGHGPMEAATFDNRERHAAIWKANGDEITTVEERRAKRLEREAARAKTATSNG